MALAIIPGVVLMSFAQARRIRPIYRSVRKDVEQIDGRVGETFSRILEHRQFVFGVSAIAGRHGARFRSAEHGGRQAR